MAALINPAIIPSDEAERLAAIRRYDILDTPPDGAFDRITALAARLFNVPIAIVSIVDHDRIWFKSHHGLDVDEIERLPGLCASAILQPGPWIVANAPIDPRALANPLVAGEFGLKFYAAAPLRTADGHNLGTLCVLDFQPRQLTADETATLEDLSAMVMSELDLRLATRRALEQAQERELLKDAFVGMLSHELRTPITTIYAAAHLLTSNEAVKADPRASELFPDIASEAEHLLRLTEDLLVLTRIEQGQLVASAEPVLLQRVLPHAITVAGRRWSGRSIRLTTDPDLPPVAGDQVYVEQVVTNLLSNALKYSAAESAIDVVARRVDHEVEVRIRDRGIGVAPDQREAIFGLLVRTDVATRHAPGAGIGLYVCRRLLETMGGRIWAEAAPDRGTVFAFRVPIATD
ncbi:MAG: GAF domain-containing protein [Chloroflexi bacterium]|nr:GAF domain-containing protein [Chloroflexota bacterium]